MKRLVIPMLVLIPAAALHSATPSVTLPAANATVTSPFQLSAAATKCGLLNRPVTAMGYSLDSQPDIATMHGQAVNAQVTATAGKHTLRVKAWNDKGGICVNQVPITVTVIPPPPPPPPVVEVPEFSLRGGAYDAAQTLSIADATAGAVILYSVDGSVPSLTYTAPLTISATETVKAVGTETGFTNSSEADATFIIQVPASAVSFAPLAGTYTGSVTVSLGDDTPGSQIYYTTSSNSVPTLYDTPFVLTADSTITAYVVAPGYANGPSTAATYVIAPLPAGPVIPPTAKLDSDIQALPNKTATTNGWHMNHDAGTPGNSTGTSVMKEPPNASPDGKARQFNYTYTGSGGEIFSVSYDHDGTSHDFVYDTLVYIPTGAQLVNLEMDTNQVMPNGQLFIFGFQCAGTAGVWEFGGPWVKSSAPCDPRKWARDTWHHIQVWYTRDDAGFAHYHSVWFDGVEAKIDGQQQSLRSTKWGKNIIQTQFQIDGSGAGGGTLYADQMKVYHW